MLFDKLKRTARSAVGLLMSRYRTRGSASALQHQAVDLNVIKRERWTEADVDALPTGEHDYFERKSGQLFASTGDLLGKLAKTISALANSGGGHIVLGVDDSGVPDGVPTMVGNTSVRDWLEQKVPYLVDYPLADFRVHEVTPSSPSRIPPGRVVIVIDVGDSALAPHQCAHGGGDARKHTYYYRQAGRSEPAPHFYLELLRQRLVSPVLQAKLSELIPVKAASVDEGAFLAMRLRFLIQNIGRVAAYKWQLQITEMSGHPQSRGADYRFRTRDYPPGWTMPSGIRLDDTILPGGSLEEDKDLGVVVRVQTASVPAVQAEIEVLLADLRLGFRLATEVSPGNVEHVALRAFVDVPKLAGFVGSSLGV